MNQKEGLKVWKQIRAELTELLKNNTQVPDEIWKKSGNFLYQAVTKKNPNYAFMIMDLCDKLDFTPTKTMQKVFAQAGTWVMTGSALGTHDKIIRDSRSQERLIWVAHLLAVGNTLKLACQKTAMLSRLNWPDYPVKASTIEKQYQTFRNKGGTDETQEEAIFRLHALPINADMHEEWKKISDSTPECLPELIGETR